MFPRLVVFLAFAVGCVAQSRYAGSGWTVSNPVVIELFTSEGCSSCPAADKVLSRLESGAIVLGEHVDYWDGSEWKDRFSSPLFSARQQEYGIAMHSGNVYTPQVVINGEKEALGSNTGAVAAAIASANSRPMAPVTLRMSRSNVSISVGKLPQGSHKADVLLAISESGLMTTVNGGENAGHQLRHIPVVRSMSKLTELDPARPGEYTAEARLNVRTDWNRANLRIVLLVQDKETRRILGAAAIKP